MRKMKRKKLRSMCAKLASGTEDVSTMECASVWDVICDTKEVAADMRARTYLLYSIHKSVEQRRWNLAEAAHHRGVTEEQMQALQRGRVSRFTQVELNAIADKLEHAQGLQAGQVKGIFRG